MFRFTVNYALFPNRKLARDAATRLENSEAEIALVTEATDLDRARLPIAERVAIIIAGSIAVGLALTAITGLLLYFVDALPEHLASAYAVTATVIMFATLLGGVAGAVTDSTRVRQEAKRLRELVRRGSGVMLFESDRELREVFRHLGAIQTGTLA